MRGRTSALLAGELQDIWQNTKISLPDLPAGGLLCRITNLDGMPCRFYSDDDEEFYDCSSSRRSSSADVSDAMVGLKTASGSSDRSQDGKARIQGDTDWIE